MIFRTGVFALLASLAVSCQGGAEPPKANPQQAGPSPFVLDREKKEVARHDVAGKVVWAVQLEGDIGGVRPPHLAWDEQRVYLTHNQGVTALDARTGKSLWHTDGLERGLLLSKGLLLGTGSLPNKGGGYSHWLFACDATKGAVVFKIPLPEDMSDPRPVREVAGLFLVQIDESPDGRRHALLLDREGAVRHRFDRQVVGSKRCAADVILLTSKDVVRVTAKNQVVWTAPFDEHQWLAGGELIDLPNGDMIASQFGRICDSGVSLMRFDPASGRTKWKRHCQGLRVSHSEYEHTASVAVLEEKLRVTSKGSSGTFVEILDLRTGRQLKRERKGR